MKKLKYLFIFLILSITLINAPLASAVNADNDKIYLGGMPAGFSLYTRGAYIVGLSDVITADGIASPAKACGITIGDTILSIDNAVVNNAEDIERNLKDCEIKTLEILRNETVFSTKILPAKDITGNIKLGVFIRDSVNGIGTITFIKGNRFASLGHPVTNDNGGTIEIVGGSLFSCNITGVVKGEKGTPGELRGAFLKTKGIAKIEKNIISGVYGSTNERFNKSKLTEIEIGEGKIGEASIYTTIEGSEPKEYKISIVKVSDGADEIKNYVVKINDAELLQKTGGIVQGMSGSPIVQNGKLVGAVTHVFINDPTRGFGISINNMINN